MCVCTCRSLAIYQTCRHSDFTIYYSRTKTLDRTCPTFMGMNLMFVIYLAYKSEANGHGGSLFVDLLCTTYVKSV